LGCDKLLIVIVLYSPDYKTIERNVSSYSELSDILLIDNTEDQDAHHKANIESLIRPRGKNCIILINNEGNLGLSKAFNMGGKYALKYGYTHFLTLDQDSIFNVEDLKKLLKCASKIEFFGVIGPKINYSNPKKNVQVENGKAYCVNVPWVISSGSLINVKSFISVNGFDERYFIDGVDADFCFRLRNKGYPVLICKESILYQTLGLDDLFLGIPITLRSSGRYYYVVRNKFLLLRYKKNNAILSLAFSVIKLLLFVLFFEPNKLKKFFFVYKGLRDGVKKKYGKGLF